MKANTLCLIFVLSFPNGSASKESTFNAGDTGDAGSIPGLGRFPGEGNGNPLQYSCLENLIDRGVWWATLQLATYFWHLFAFRWWFCCLSYCCFSVTKTCLTLCDPMNCSTPGFRVPHHLLEFAQIHVHWLCDVIQPSHLLSPSSLQSSISQYQVFSK